VAPQVAGQLGGGGVAPVALLGQRLPHDRVHVPAEGAVERAQRHGLRFRHGPDGVGQAAAHVVGEPAGQELVKDHAQRVDVAADVEVGRVGRHLLRAHVGERAHDLAGGGLQGGLPVRVGGARHAEVQDLGLARRVDQDVRRLQVPVDDRLLMGVMDGIADAGDQLQFLPHARVRARHVLAQRGPVDPLHREVGLRAMPGVRGSRLVDLGDAGMLELPQQPRLLVEPAQGVLGGDPRPDDLERDLPFRLLLERLVHRSHPALADEAEDAIGTDVGGKDARGGSGCTPGFRLCLGFPAVAHLRIIRARTSPGFSGSAGWPR
jgi:hypothetical protein